MNNIEILEEFIKYFEAEATQRKYRRNISITVGEDDIEAIENPIQENKELKEKREEYEKQLDLDYVEENYIQKSKLKEKIEKLEKPTANAFADEINVLIIHVLKNLLEGE